MQQDVTLLNRYTNDAVIELVMALPEGHHRCLWQCGFEQANDIAAHNQADVMFTETLFDQGVRHKANA
jgi:hypothetical protein